MNINTCIFFLQGLRTTPLKDYDSEPLASSVGCHENLYDLDMACQQLPSIVGVFVLRVIQGPVDWASPIFLVGSFRVFTNPTGPQLQGVGKWKRHKLPRFSAV